MATAALLLGLCLSLSSATASYKLINFAQAYFYQVPSSGLLHKRVDATEELPIYRDLPPIKRSTPEDLSVALEATRNLKFARPPLDAEAFYQGLRKAAEEARAVVANIAPPILTVQVNKSIDLPEVKENKADEKPDPSQDEPEAKASELVVSVQAPYTNVQVRKGGVKENVPPPVYLDSAAVPDSQAGFALDVQAPFTNVQVRKGGVLENAPPLYLDPEAGPEPQVSKGALAEDGLAPVKLGDLPPPGVRVDVEAPFTNVKVRKLSGDPGVGVGVNVEAPFTRVNVDTLSVRRSFLTDLMNSRRQSRPALGEPPLLPGRYNNGKPLDLDINIPGIFNLKLLRDENGRGRLGIGVLPIFSSLVNKNRPLDKYPGPPPPHSR